MSINFPHYGTLRRFVSMHSLSAYKNFLKIQCRWLALVFLCLLSACQDSKLENLLEKANEEWVRGRNHSAVELFKSVLEIAPSGVYAEEALFRLGEIYLFGLDDHTQAINYFKEVFRENPKGRFGYDAQKYIASIVETQFQDYDQAIIEYQNLINNYDLPQENAEHQYHIATLFMKKQNYEQAAVELEILLEKYPKSTWAEQAEYKVVETLYTLGECDQSREHYQQYVEKRPLNRYRPEMDFVMASCLEESGKLEKALASFKALKGRYKYPQLVAMKVEGIESRIKKEQPPKEKTKKRKRRRR